MWIHPTEARKRIALRSPTHPSLLYLLRGQVYRG